MLVVGIFCLSGKAICKQAKKLASSNASCTCEVDNTMLWETWLTNIKYHRYVSRMQGTMTRILCNEALTQDQRKNGVCRRTQKIGRSSSLRRKPWRNFTTWWDATCHCFNKNNINVDLDKLETLELREHRNHRPLPCKSSPRLRSPWSPWCDCRPSLDTAWGVVSVNILPPIFPCLRQSCCHHFQFKCQFLGYPL